MRGAKWIALLELTGKLNSEVLEHIHRKQPFHRYVATIYRGPKMADPEKPTSRNIPLPIQREVRQRCGFGCIVCGMPLYEYEHMLGWANVQRHVAEEITLLCDQHHKEKTNGLLPLEAVIEANKIPHNLRKGVSKPYDLHFYGEKCEIIIGGNKFTAKNQGYGTFIVPIAIDGGPLIGFVLGDDHLLMSTTI